MIVKIVGIFFVVVGTVISLIFWVPGFINKDHLRQIMGHRYPMIYFIYVECHDIVNTFRSSSHFPTFNKTALIRT